MRDEVYDFIVAQPCLTDLTGDGLVNSADLSQLLGMWGDCPAFPEPCLADFNFDGFVNSLDLPELLGSWGPCEGGESLMEGGGDGPIYQQFGFESAEEYAEWFDGLSEEERAAHLAELMALPE